MEKSSARDYPTGKERMKTDRSRGGGVESNGISELEVSVRTKTVD